MVQCLIFQLAMFGKQNCEIVIMEGIFNSKWYNNLFKKLSNEFKDNTFAFYFNIPFEETLKRHQTRSQSQEFGAEKIARWWKDSDISDVLDEKNFSCGDFLAAGS